MKHHRQVPFGGNLRDLPRLRTSGPKDNFFSKNWKARGRVQQVGASLFATLFFVSSLAMIVASAVLQAQVSNAVEGILGRVLGAAVALVPCLMACALIFFAVRLIKGVNRSLHQ
jgi:TRAP-type C4-dicarboxylate transport system permease small subunit